MLLRKKDTGFRIQDEENHASGIMHHASVLPDSISPNNLYIGLHPNIFAATLSLFYYPLTPNSELLTPNFLALA